ncbi:hypothetical protein BC629DRAFT_1441869 [Irpex lacteus]|nr:hypothetical protein BC629DRAFT_1441869 [Irpex lacteus]
MDERVSRRTKKDMRTKSTRLLHSEVYGIEAAEYTVSHVAHQDDERRKLSISERFRLLRVLWSYTAILDAYACCTCWESARNIAHYYEYKSTAGRRKDNCSSSKEHRTRKLNHSSPGKAAVSHATKLSTGVQPKTRPKLAQRSKQEENRRKRELEDLETEGEEGEKIERKGTKRRLKGKGKRVAEAWALIYVSARVMT